MIERTYKVATVAVLAVGIVHTVATFRFYPALTEASIWFAGAGLGGIFVALLNVALWAQYPSVLSWRPSAAGNGLFLAWLAAGVLATPQLPQFIVGSVGAVMVVSAFWLYAKSS
ncbi:MAG: hypothetical protein WBG05_14005 [Thermoanaerobaculia bacterium]